MLFPGKSAASQQREMGIMSGTEGYNGWTNRATWAYVLWMDNEQGSYAGMIETAERILEEQDPLDAEHGGEPGNESQDTIDALADAYETEARQFLDPEEYVENFGDVPLSAWLKGPGLIVKDVGDIDEINWREVAEHYLSTARENRKS